MIPEEQIEIASKLIFDEDRAKYLHAYLDYVEYGKEPDLNGLPKIFFDKFIRYGRKEQQVFRSGKVADRGRRREMV